MNTLFWAVVQASDNWPGGDVCAAFTGFGEALAWAADHEHFAELFNLPWLFTVVEMGE